MRTSLSNASPLAMGRGLAEGSTEVNVMTHLACSTWSRRLLSLRPRFRMADVRIYTTSYCPFCVRAKRLLDNKGVLYREVDVTADAELRERMIVESGGRRTVPQIFIDGRPLGGFEELQVLDRSGELDALLGVG
jgi:glutaredoxin 3